MMYLPQEYFKSTLTVVLDTEKKSSELLGQPNSHSFKHFLSAYYKPGTVLGGRNMMTSSLKESIVW